MGRAGGGRVRTAASNAGHTAGMLNGLLGCRWGAGRQRKDGEQMTQGGHQHNHGTSHVLCAAAEAAGPARRAGGRPPRGPRPGAALAWAKGWFKRARAAQCAALVQRSRQGAKQVPAARRGRALKGAARRGRRPLVRAAASWPAYLLRGKSCGSAAREGVRDDTRVHVRSLLPGNS
jgi:hypothetical protein